MEQTDRPDIVFYARQLYNGGVDRVVFNLAEEFLARGIHPVILVDLDNPWSPFRNLIPEGVTYEVLDAKGPIARVTKLRAYLRRTRPQAVMCTGFGFPNLVAILVRWIAGFHFRLMLTEHCFPSVDLDEARPWQSRYWFFRLAHLFYPRADTIVAVSKGTALDLAKVIDIDPGTITCIYNPIVSDGLIESGQAPVDHPWFRDPDVPIVMGVGRLEHQKDFGTLITAFAKVRKQMRCRLIILGDGSERPMLTDLVNRLGLSEDVSMPGFAPNPHAYTAKASLFVLSSRFESLANVVIEAMALGTPVIATDCPSGPAEALDHGRFGKLVNVEDPDMLADAMLDVLNKRPAPVPTSWLEQFTTRVSANRYLELLTPAPGC
ncbi:glycosyltransferase involved in cell wall biosynthesis [Novosphingobium sp. PhB165]|uniref:glycosyltransferase n=1 Tax=Novosphingobium sp. PhB165 TaxID=2485105 RepID=UPI00104EA6D6|nr:glycosyltransferase [Novosphingobium sp. PhB165]TCM20834.1 glycosyltransferase involved in cell wall biosynthesis [Novosphingobium sp. PhB165]